MLEVDWIVCRDRERGVIDGRIWCPATDMNEEGREIHLQECLDCRHLMASPLDRRSEGMCAAET